MSESKLISKPGLKERLKGLGKWLKAFLFICMAYIVMMIARVCASVMIILFAVVMFLFNILFGSIKTGDVIVIFGELLRKYRI